MNTPANQPVNGEDQIKKARMLGYSVAVRQGLTNSTKDGVKAASAEDLVQRAGPLVKTYGERLEKRAGVLTAVYAAIIDPVPAA